MEATDWHVVKKKKAAKKMVRREKTPRFKVEMHPVLQLSDTVQEQNTLIQKIYSTMENVKQSEFWCSCQVECFSVCQRILTLSSEQNDSDRHETTSPQIESTHTKGMQKAVFNPDCVCYGLGNFSSCVISRHQLAFLLLFLEELKVPRDQTYIFDPVFLALEKSVLKNLGLTVILENEEGKCRVSKPTVFYMPHCGKALYNNLLWSNWTQETLSNIVIIGNSFKGIEERLVSRILQKDYVYIHESLKVVEEAALPESHQYNDVFNDTAIHHFPIQKLRTLPSELWQLQDVPQYQDCDDLEIIRKPENVKQSEFWCSCQVECFSVCQRILTLSSEQNDSDRHETTSPQIESTHTQGMQKAVFNPDCVCYGLGNFSSCVISRHQLAFLLLFLKELKVPRDQTCIFDPVFSALEKSVLKNLGLTVILENEEGKCRVSKPTVFYMPHCGKALYNNLLWSNWTQETLSNIVIIGNSFKGIEERLVSRIRQKDYVYVHESLQVVEEAALPESHQYNDVFNDTAIHHFPIQKLRTLPSEAWQLQDVPQYQHCDDLEIIRKP